MQTEMGDQLHTQGGVGKLKEGVQPVRQPADLTLSRVPPVILLDALGVTLFESTTAHGQDQLGRQRIPKQREKVGGVGALGLYPPTGRWGILAWTLADRESPQAGKPSLAPLEMRGLYRERGVELFVQDGGMGLVAARRLMSPPIPPQRCLLHTLRNLGHAIHPPTALPRDEAHGFKRNLLKPAHAVFFAATADAAAQRRHAFGVPWVAEQPDVVATLGRDWPVSPPGRAIIFAPPVCLTGSIL